MAMTKAEMEGHHAAYHAVVAKARQAQQSGLYPEAIAFAMSSWEHVDGMMQYDRKQSGNADVATIEGIEIVLNCAPFVLDVQSLDNLDELLKSQRRIIKNTSENLTQRLSTSRTLLWAAHDLWNHLE